MKNPKTTEDYFKHIPNKFKDIIDNPYPKILFAADLPFKGYVILFTDGKDYYSLIKEASLIQDYPNTEVKIEKHKLVPWIRWAINKLPIVGTPVYS